MPIVQMGKLRLRGVKSLGEDCRVNGGGSGDSQSPLSHLLLCGVCSQPWGLGTWNLLRLMPPPTTVVSIPRPTRHPHIHSVLPACHLPGNTSAGQRA